VRRAGVLDIGVFGGGVLRLLHLGLKEVRVLALQRQRRGLPTNKAGSAKREQQPRLHVLQPEPSLAGRAQLQEQHLPALQQHQDGSGASANPAKIAAGAIPLVKEAGRGGA
jgi:hypothetical protein